MPSSRRDFLYQSTQLAAGLSLTTLPTLAQKQAAPSDTIRVGLIGANNMGWSDLTSMLKNQDATCVALCDVDSNVLNRRSAELEKKTGKKVSLYSDFRKLLDDKTIDAVIVGTPDHWHCLPAVQACQAGKDVYVEKPLANSIEECDLMVAAAKKYNRIVQVGQWQRSGPHWKAAVDYVQSGKIGTVRTVKTWAFMGYGKEFPPKPNAPVPAGVDYDMWLGPAPNRPFNPNRFHGSFRYYWDYAGGLMTDWGAHMIDIALWGMNVTDPQSVVAMGGKFGFPNHDGDTPDTMQVIYDYSKFSILWEQSLGTMRGPYNRDHGVAFIGNLGTVVIDRSKWEVFPEVEQGRYLSPAIPVQKSTNNDLDSHTRNFLDCIRSRKPTNCPAEAGRNVALHSHLGNIAYRIGNKLNWDVAKGGVVNDTSAQTLAKAHYRTPWVLPKLE
ncbi:Gfo/Idh/MocA family oxidoreductase [Spirosoma daeguense]